MAAPCYKTPTDASPVTERTSGPPPVGLDLDALLTALRLHRVTVLAFAILVVAAAATVTALTPRQYRAVALIRLMPRAGQEVEVDAVVKHDDGGYMEARERARTQLQIIQSRGIREETLKRYAAMGHDEMGSGEAGLQELANALTVAPREDTELVEVGVLHASPEQAAILANLVTEVYATTNLESRTDAARNTSGWISSQEGTTKAELDAASAKVMAFKTLHDVADIEEKVDGISARMEALQRAAGEATTRRVMLESQYAEHRRLLARGDAAVLAGMFDDAGLQTMARERALIVTEAADVLSRYGEAHPDHQRAVARIKRVEDLIAEEVKRNVEAERSEIEALQRQEAQVAAEMEAVKVDLLEKQRLQGEYQVLKESEDRARGLLRSLGERSAEVSLQARTQLNDVRIIDPAIPPTSPATPNWKLNLAVALMVGLGGGVGLALLRFRLNATYLTTADLARSLPVPLLGVILRLKGQSAPSATALYGFERPRSRMAECFRGIRAIIQTMPARAPCRRIVVTSTLPEEGKSFASVGIAVAFAQLGQRVLLVDADLRLPRLHVLFDTHESPGLTDMRLDGDPSSGVRPTKVERLHLLPCGTRVEFPNEFLAAPATEDVLAALSKDYDVIVIDTPPAGLLTDCLAVARRADGVILIVRRDKAARAQVERVFHGLEAADANVLGAVLNDVPLDRDDAGYGSRYYDESARSKRPDPAA